MAFEEDEQMEEQGDEEEEEQNGPAKDGVQLSVFLVIRCD